MFVDASKMLERVWGKLTLHLVNLIIILSSNFKKMDAIFTKAIYEQILLISDIELQKKMWLNTESKLISSYPEIMCTLYDVNLFEDFVFFGAQNMKFSTVLIAKLQVLNKMLNNYKEIGYYLDIEEKIIKDENWLVIVNQANDIIKDWPDVFKSDFLKLLD
jgi:hypothetical protein